ncbi:MAG: ATP-binding protein [bacterium]|nr:ATP-binding protein [bacterium]
MISGNPSPTNPFTPDFGTRPAHLASGRALIHEAIRSLASGPRDSGYTRLILGHRGSGKTTILAEIRELARASGMLALSADAATSGLPARLTSAIDRAREPGRHTRSPSPWTERRLRLSGFQLGPFGANWEELPPTQQQWSLGRRLEALAEWASEQGSAVLLTVDEMHAVDREEARRLAADIQSITKIDGLPLALVGAGLPEMADTVLADRKMTFFHRCHRDRMPHTGYDGAWRCLRLTAEDAGGSVEAEALDLMASAASGAVPFKLQSIGYHAWALSGAPERDIDLMAARAAVGRAEADMSEKVLEPMWGDLSDLDRTYLGALSSAGGAATPAQLAALIPDTAVRSLARTEQRLAGAGHITRSPDGVVSLTGALDRSFIQAATDLEALYRTGTPLAPPARRRCNADMPRARARCALTLGHTGGHRSRA